jgi:hypothetical protein
MTLNILSFRHPVGQPDRMTRSYLVPLDRPLLQRLKLKSDEPLSTFALNFNLRRYAVGEEGFFGASTPLYLFANPGSWAGLEAGASTCPKPCSSAESPNIIHRTCS